MDPMGMPPLERHAAQLDEDPPVNTACAKLWQFSIASNWPDSAYPSLAAGHPHFQPESLLTIGR
jgi:hypothetical protein